MAWRPTRYLLEGELDNTVPNKVTGWMKFAGMKEKVTLDLEGDFHRDIRGAKICFVGEGQEDDPEAASYMESFAECQTGKVGDMTAGMPPYDYVKGYCYLEWYGDENGRVVIELESHQVDVIGTPLPWQEREPISRETQAQNMGGFLNGLAKDLGVPSERAVCVGLTSPKQSTQKNNGNGKPRGMKLLTKELRKKLPALYSQEELGGKAIAYAKFFTPDSNWSFWPTEFDGQDTFFGLVEGQFKEVGYFSLSELESARGHLGLPIERDRHWEPKTLEVIAPEMFRRAKRGGDLPC